METTSSEKFLSQIPDLWNRISLLKNELDEPIEYIRISNLPGQILLSEKELAKRQLKEGSEGLFTINQFLHLVQKEALREEREDEQRQKMLEELKKLLEDVKNHMTLMISACFSSFLHLNPLLQRNPGLEFISSYQSQQLNSPDELESQLRSLGLLYYHRFVEGSHFSNIHIDKIKSSVGEFQSIMEQSLHTLNASLKECSSLPPKAFEDFDKGATLRRSNTLHHSVSQTVFPLASPRNRSQSKQLTQVKEASKMPGSICGKGKGIVCSQTLNPPLCFVLSNEGTLRGFEINPKSSFFKSLFSKKFDLGGEDWSQSVSLSPNETTLLISGANSSRIYIVNLNGELIHSISKEENDKAWMFASTWVSNETIATGYSDGRLRVFKVGSDQHILELKPFYGRVFSLLSSSGGKHIYCGSTSGHVALISTETKNMEALERPISTWIHTMALDDEGKQLACGGDGKEVVIMNSLTFEQLGKVSVKVTGDIQTLIWKKTKYQLNGTLYIVTDNEVVLVRSFSKGFLGKGERKWEKVFELKKATKSNIHSGFIQWSKMLLLVGDEEGFIYKANLKELLAQ